LRLKNLKQIFIPLFIFIIITAGFILFLLFSSKFNLTNAGINAVIFVLGALFVTSTIILVFSVYHYSIKDKTGKSNEFLKKAKVFEDFYEIFYEYSVEKLFNSEIVKSLHKKFTKLSIYLSDRTIKLFNDYFSQNQLFETNVFQDKKQLKQKPVTFEQCVLALREELGLDILKSKSINEINRTSAIFTGLELNWFEWNKHKLWFFEMCRDYGPKAMDYMKKHNLIFIGGGPKGCNANVIKQIKKGDIILAHKYDEGYIGLGIVTVETKTIIWPKDNPLMYNDGEIRIPVRWLLFLNVGVNAGYTPKGLITRIRELEKGFSIIEALYTRANESGNDFSQTEIKSIIENIKSLCRINKPRPEDYFNL
jgi:hypothetical protein